MSRTALRTALVTAVILTAGSVSLVSAESTSAQRYELTGSATLTVDPSTQRSADLRLRATLAPNAVANEALPAQSGGGFELTAFLSASSLVCYNDTIFRDDFDGDGF
jgi:hypothetical protein